MSSVKHLKNKEQQGFLQQLEIAPSLTIPTYLLKNNLAEVFSDKDFSNYIFQSHLDPEEPIGFGNDAEVLWAILQKIKGWHCINVSQEVAHPLSKIIQTECKCGIRQYGDIYFKLIQKVKMYPREGVRKLSIADLPLLQSFGFKSAGHHSLEEAITKGKIFGTIKKGVLVSVSYISAFSERYADITVATKNEFQNQGYSTATSSKLIEEIQNTSQLIPIWSTGEDNFSSLKVALKLGFKKMNKRIYLIKNNN